MLNCLFASQPFHVGKTKIGGRQLLDLNSIPLLEQETITTPKFGGSVVYFIRCTLIARCVFFAQYFKTFKKKWNFSIQM